LADEELEDEPAGGGRFKGGAGDMVGKPVPHPADLALDDVLDGGAKESEPGALGTLPEAALKDVGGSRAHGELVSGGEIAQTAQRVEGDPGGDLGLVGHGGSEIFWGALLGLSYATAQRARALTLHSRA
jgi:hypothetical protein